jgi:hypothetical protein
MKIKLLSSFALAAIALLFAACAHYGFSGSLPGYIRTAAVPLFQNDTVEPGIVEDVTDAVSSAIISNGTMKVVGESSSDAVVKGTIVNVLDEADTFSKDEKAKQFRIRILANVEFFDRVKNRAIWEEKNLEGWARYDASSASARDDAKKAAAKMLADLIIDKTLAGW